MANNSLSDGAISNFASIVPSELREKSFKDALVDKQTIPEDAEFVVQLVVSIQIDGKRGGKSPTSSAKIY